MTVHDFGFCEEWRLAHHGPRLKESALIHEIPVILQTAENEFCLAVVYLLSLSGLQSLYRVPDMLDY